MENDQRSETYKSGVFCAGRKTERNDLLDLVGRGKIENNIHGRTIFNDEEIEHAVNFMLHSDNVQHVLCGTKRIKRNGEVRKIPSVM